MNSTESRIEQLLTSPVSLNATETIKEGWKMLMREPGMFIGFALISMIISTTAGMIPFVGIFASVIISGPLAAGYLNVCYKLDKNEPITFGDFFAGFNKISPFIVVSIFQFIMVGIGFILLFFPGIYLAVAYAFIYPLVWFGGLEGWGTLEASRKLITKIWWQFFGLLILLVLVNLLGLLALGIGILFTIPLSGICIYVAYKNTIGLDNTEMNVEDHLV
ncbi:MAG: hypothetical protein N4A46_15395 [Schleiferiaceae bacterium]|jgi:hypothetical protein|nr:hypothetical protein [Schleiferiaceae bacterium]